MLAIIPVPCCNITMKFFYALLALMILGGCSSSESYTESVPIAATVTQEAIAEKSIMLIGDSITYRMPPFPEIEGATIDNRGENGNYLIREKNMVCGRFTYCPDMIIIMLGINDIYRSHLEPPEYSLRDAIDAYEGMIGEIEIACPDSEICIQSVLPVTDGLRDPVIEMPMIASLNEWLDSFCYGRGIEFINHHNLFLGENGELDEAYTVDGVHLSNDGYEILQSALIPYITGI